jgi:hypothetical protein
MPLRAVAATRDLADVTSLQQRPDSAPPQPSGPALRHLALLSAATALAVLPFALGMMLPYYANDLDELPREGLEIGLPSVDTTWPLGTGWGDLAAVLCLTLALPALFAVILLAVRWAVTARRARPAISIGFVVLALAGTAVLAWRLSPTGMALTTWLLD